jgi:hypothetical protein
MIPDNIEIVEVSKVEFHKHNNQYSENNKTEKICSACKQIKLRCHFYNDNGRCKECRSKYIKNRYAKSTNRTIDQIRTHRVTIIEGKKICGTCREIKLLKEFNQGMGAGWRSSKCKKCLNKYWKNYYTVTVRVLKKEFVNAYGGCCSCCGEAELDFLTIEHIKYKGHELIYDQSFMLLKKLKALGWPEGYTCLCWNCNEAIRFDKTCPHSINRKIDQNANKTSTGVIRVGKF